MDKSLRTQILEMSLTIESLFSDMLGILMRIPKKESRTIGNKSSAFSLKSKVDFLFDLGKLTKQECKDLQLFMEVRNQFIHNMDIDTMVMALEITGHEKKIGQFMEDANESDWAVYPSVKESDYRIGFHNFYGMLLGCIENALKMIGDEIAAADEQKQRAAEHAFLNKYIELLSDAIDETSDAFDKIFDRTEEDGGAFRRSVQGRFFIKLKEAFPDRDIPIPGIQ